MEEARPALTYFRELLHGYCTRPSFIGSGLEPSFIGSGTDGMGLTLRTFTIDLYSARRR